MCSWFVIEEALFYRSAEAFFFDGDGGCHTTYISYLVAKFRFFLKSSTKNIFFNNRTGNPTGRVHVLYCPRIHRWYQKPSIKISVENSIYYIHTKNHSVLFFYDIILEFQNMVSRWKTIDQMHAKCMQSAFIWLLCEIKLHCKFCEAFVCILHAVFCVHNLIIICVHFACCFYCSTILFIKWMHFAHTNSYSFFGWYSWLSKLKQNACKILYT